MSRAQSSLLVRGAGRPDDPIASSILVEGGRIRALGAEADTLAPGAGRVIEADGLLAAPGYIDLQVNGAGGHDLTGDPDLLTRVAESLPRYGVTAFLPTIVSAPQEVHQVARAALAAFRVSEEARASTPLGFHIEGPFLSPERAGIHDPAELRLPDRSLTRPWAPAQGVRLVTLAPELPGALELIAELAGRGVVVSAGHTAASEEVGRAAIDAGVRYATHLFNSMPPLDHRAAGIAAALLADRRVTVGLIPDGIHVAPLMIDLVWRIAGPDRVSVVTDAIAALGMPPGRYRLGRAQVDVDGEAARVGSRLAGSIIGLDAAVRNLRRFTGVSAAAAVATVTAVPARLLGLADRGVIAAGAVGDLTLLSPDLEVVATIVGGVVAHTSEGEWA